jgi:hypothetical protein
MTMTKQEAAAYARRVRWDKLTPEQRSEETRPGRIAAAVKALVDQAPALTEEQKNRLRAILAAAPGGGPGA